MKAEFLNREINTVSMKMEITAEEFDSAIDKVYKENRKRSQCLVSEKVRQQER